LGWKEEVNKKLSRGLGKVSDGRGPGKEMEEIASAVYRRLAMTFVDVGFLQMLCLSTLAVDPSNKPTTI
jgi:hypothetical protein